MMDPKPVPGALEGLIALRTLGYKLCIVTARHEKEQTETDRWLNKYFASELIHFITVLFLIYYSRSRSDR